MWGKLNLNCLCDVFCWVCRLLQVFSQQYRSEAFRYGPWQWWNSLQALRWNYHKNAPEILISDRFSLSVEGQTPQFSYCLKLEFWRENCFVSVLTDIAVSAEDTSSVPLAMGREKFFCGKSGYCKTCFSFLVFHRPTWTDSLSFVFLFLPFEQEALSFPCYQKTTKISVGYGMADVCRPSNSVKSQYIFLNYFAAYLLWRFPYNNR